MTVLVCGLRALGISSDGHGVWSDGQSLSNNGLSVCSIWTRRGRKKMKICLKARAAAGQRWVRNAGRFGLRVKFELRAIAEVYAQNDNGDKFIADFIAAWTKVMNADRLIWRPKKRL